MGGGAKKSHPGIGVAEGMGDQELSISSNIFSWVSVGL